MTVVKKEDWKKIWCFFIKINETEALELKTL